MRVIKLALALVLVVLIVLLGGGNHGPGRHQASRSHGDPQASVATAARDRG